MKQILIAIFLLISFNLQAEKGVDQYETKIHEILNKINVVKDKNIEKENILNIFNKINQNKSYTEYKKELLKANVILFYQTIYIADSEKELLSIAKKSFPVSICTAFHFQGNTTNILNGLLSDILNTDLKASKYIKSSEFLYSESLMNKLKAFMPNSKKEIELNCVQGKTFPLI
jgi:superfamily I DNA and RNA helicase